MSETRFDEAEWKTLPRGDVAPHWSGLYVTLNKKGAITISGITHQRLGSPTAYLIRLDPANQRLALEPSKVGERNAYPARTSGRRGAKVIRAHRLLTQWGIYPPDTLEFRKPKIDLDGRLIVEFANAVISPKAWSQCRKKEDGASPEIFVSR